MNGTSKRWAVTGRIALLLGGVWLLGLGLYFIALRPPLLPEDERFIGTSLQEASALLPGLVHVFDVLGGFAAALGCLVVWLVASGAATRVQRGGAAAGLVVCAWMAATNFALQSDFRWVLSAAVLPWLIALVALLTRQPETDEEGIR